MTHLPLVLTRTAAAPRAPPRLVHYRPVPRAALRLRVPGRAGRRRAGPCLRLCAWWRARARGSAVAADLPRRAAQSAGPHELRHRRRPVSRPPCRRPSATTACGVSSPAAGAGHHHRRGRTERQRGSTPELRAGRGWRPQDPDARLRVAVWRWEVAGNGCWGINRAGDPE